jgi:hypothetical protein
MAPRLQVGIDFSHRAADACLLDDQGEFLVSHRSFANALDGYDQLKALLLKTLQEHGFQGLDISGEATSYYWLPFFLRLAEDPVWQPYALRLSLLNPRWVHWCKRSLGQESKSDRTDPFYIAKRTLMQRPPAPWLPEEALLPLRFLTRQRFHLALDLVREKNFFSAHLFLLFSAYRKVKPFSDLFGQSSTQVLAHYPTPQALASAPLEDLVACLHLWSHNALRDPQHTAHLLQQVGQASFSLPEPFQQPLQELLARSLEHIRFLEIQMDELERQILAQAPTYPGIGCLDTIPGLGPIVASGVVAEVGDLHRFLAPAKWDPRRQVYRARTLRDAEDAIAKIAGLWWPEQSSGDFAAEDRNLAHAGNRYLRYYLVQAAEGMRQYIPSYHAYYQRKFKEVPKHQHKRALVLTARKGLGLIVGLLHRQEPYRPQGDDA